MNHRSIRQIGAVALASLFVASVASAGGNVNEREARQRHRIRAGITDGSLTRPEAHRLKHEQVRIERTERRFRRNDGHLGPRERHRLDTLQDRSARHIRRSRHNDRNR
jgi:hypothetical protein